MTDQQRLRMRKDFIEHVSSQLTDVLQRNMDLAANVFENTERGVMLIEIAAGVQMGVILFCLQAKKDDVDRYELFDMVAGAIATRVAQNRPHLPDALRAVERAGGMPVK